MGETRHIEICEIICWHSIYMRMKYLYPRSRKNHNTRSGNRKSLIIHDVSQLSSELVTTNTP